MSRRNSDRKRRCKKSMHCLNCRGMTIHVLFGNGVKKHKVKCCTICGRVGDKQ